MTINRRMILASGIWLASQTLRSGLLSAAVAEGPRPMVTTRHGQVVGHRLGEINVFKGIPFAKPPIGPLRFRPPESPADWHDPLDAGAFGPAPIQSIAIAEGTSEDCLTLNVWAPAEPGPHPVLFMIFGGGNSVGSPSRYDGTSFASHGLVFVSANYRLGALGFLELGGIDPAYTGSGNNAMLDLQAALRWVRDNIASFGGNPDQVTVMGQSAGARNVCTLATMPSARGLFHRLSIQSGAPPVFRSPEEAAPVAKAMLAAAGLDGRDVSGLAALPVGALLTAQGKMEEALPFGRPYRPTVDGTVLPQAPIEAARSGVTAGFDIVIGTARDEAASATSPAAAEAPFTAHQLSNVDLDGMRAVEARYAKLLPSMSLAERHLRQLTAEGFWIPSVRFTEAHVRAGGKAWVYRFDIAPTSGRYAGYAVHGSDLAFIFDNAAIAASPLAEEILPELARVNAMWANWARTGIPALSGGPKWPRYDERRRQTFIFDRVARVEADPRGDERRLWDGVV